MIATTEPAPDFDLAGKRIFVAGHRGMVGSALVRRLALEECEILTVERAKLDLTRQAEVEAWMGRNRPDGVIIAAARVGGIQANAAQPTEFLYENLMIATNLIASAAETGVAKLLFLGSSCIYPRLAAQPIDEDQLLQGALEPTNEAYAIAKIAGLTLARSLNVQHGLPYVTAMPTNLYGPNDNFDLETSHVLPALMRKVFEAQAEGRDTVSIWGSGAPLREFLHVDDLADACVFLMRRYADPRQINVGSGEEVTIRDLATRIAEAVGYAGGFAFDATKPDGAPRKRLNSERILALGWRPTITLSAGLRSTFRWWRETEPLPQPEQALRARSA
ncbi:GDP-L-fucose synthase family protein [Hansschlegelia quercus]|uniref:GDP-L-fucose synthase n=1 Tax=Hansschlegelia quercus TaxID=2528245 RepID=A0A4V2JD73_9HYPH|nr:GDP-L-fucose synthase [Hansschlegelia quercus]TBN47310.1 GDP-L-fucose synthase [Hansschlegelia quercus]